MMWHDVAKDSFSHVIHVHTGLTSALSMGSPENLSHFKFKCITNRKQVNKIIEIVLLVTFDVLDVF